jgi:hypothetical protein
MTDITSDELIGELIHATIMSIHDPSLTPAFKLRQWSALQDDPAEFRMLLLGGAIDLFGKVLTQAVGRANAFAWLNAYAAGGRALGLEREVFGHDFARDDWKQ